MELNLNELAREAHQIAVEHGWWEKEPTFGELVALMHSELSEALEEYRAGNRIRPGQPTPMVYYSGGGYVATDTTKCCKKPEGIAVELADCIIRILDWAGHENVNMDRIFFEVMEAHKDQPEEEQRFGEFISALHNLLSMAYCDADDRNDRDIYMGLVIYYILENMERAGVEMDAIIREKMEYNRTRPYRHGGKTL